MYLPTPLSATIFTLITQTLAVPFSASQAGSKHNLYLSTCTTRSALPGCPLIIICPKKRAPTAQSYTAAAYFATTTSNTPTEMATVSERPVPWEGTTRTARLRSGAFSANIDVGGKTLAKSAIAGMAKVGSEEFMCFRDGETVFEAVSEGLIGDERSTCTADYWCASINV
jgi:hypothetical protein